MMSLMSNIIAIVSFALLIGLTVAHLGHTHHGSR